MSIFQKVSAIFFVLVISSALHAQPTTPDMKVSVYVTLYGSPDNDPPGGAIAHPNRLHRKAGGVGTFADPVTVAVKPRSYFGVGKKIYYPTLQKYFIVEDDCATCVSMQVDLWAGYGTRRGGILRCEDALTVRNATVIINPSANYAVNTTPIWNETTKQCQKPISA